MTWILYFIPLFLTLYIRWVYSPFPVIVCAILLTTISFFLSPKDMSEFYALIDRLLFYLLIFVSGLLIWRYKIHEANLWINEERYRNMIEWFPEALFVIKDKNILFINPAGIELCKQKGFKGVSSSYLDLFSPDDQEKIQNAIIQALKGGKYKLADVKIPCPEGSSISVNIWIGEIIWDNLPAVQMIIRI